LTTGLVDQGSGDACGNVTLEVAPSSFTAMDLGGNTVTLTVTDANENTATCTATVTVVDKVAPTANCQDITVELDTRGSATISPSEVDQGSGDNSGSSVSLFLDRADFDCSDVGQNTVTLRVADGSQNTASCTATVTVQDTTPPTALCKAATLELNANGEASLTADLVDDGSGDACGNVTLEVSPSNFTVRDLGENTVRLMLTDQQGNTASCQTTVTVADNQAPTAICKDIIVELDTMGSATIGVTDIDNGSYDSKGGGVSLALDRTDFSCSDIGENSVTLTATDNGGNIASCTATVLIQEVTAPLAIVTNSGPVCRGSAFQLNEISGLGTSWSWTSSGDAIFNDPGIQNPEVTNVSNGEEFTVTITLVNGCTSIGTTVALVLEAPVLKTKSEQQFCILETPTVSDLMASGYGNIRWYAEENGTAALKSDIPLADGAMYYGALENGDGCVSEKVVVRVALENCNKLDDPGKRGFSPNGDGINDTFSIYGLREDYPNYSMTIYNRNGSMVYKGNIDTPDWDGSSDHGLVLGDGKLPSGVYYYKIEFGDGTTAQALGIVFLNR
ncbi:T9SS type B sorting domain-containing protein, partial [Poritiphilus flavus]